VHAASALGDPANLTGFIIRHPPSTASPIASKEYDNRLPWECQPVVALSVLLIAAYSRPFTGEISVAPELLKQVIATEARGNTNR
jgi:hypothetical protein